MCSRRPGLGLVPLAEEEKGQGWALRLLHHDPTPKEMCRLLQVFR